MVDQAAAGSATRSNLMTASMPGSHWRCLRLRLTTRVDLVGEVLVYEAHDGSALADRDRAALDRAARTSPAA
jgi:hypothetical protein